jgi:hypothetical protein
MSLSVKQRGQYVATFRFVEVRLMEIAAAWVPSTPEMEAKLLLGPHIWDFAQAADALGKRAHELRLPLQHSIPPNAAYLKVLETLAAVSGGPQRIAGLYDAILPGLALRYRRYLAQTDTLMDAPTVRIIEAILDTGVRMVREANDLRTQMPALQLADAEWARRLAAQESDIAEIVDAPAGVDGTRQAA